MTSKELAKLACDALDDKKALEIKVINIENVSTLADYFIIASGTNHNQVQAIPTTWMKHSEEPDMNRNKLKDIRMQTGF